MFYNIKEYFIFYIFYKKIAIDINSNYLISNFCVKFSADIKRNFFIHNILFLKLTIKFSRNFFSKFQII